MLDGAVTSRPGYGVAFAFVLDIAFPFYGSFLKDTAVTFGGHRNFGPRPAEPTAWPEK